MLPANLEAVSERAGPIVTAPYVRNQSDISQYGIVRRSKATVSDSLGEAVSALAQMVEETSENKSSDSSQPERPGILGELAPAAYFRQ
jgi:hypothetical protein